MIVRGRLIKIGLPATTSASVQNIFFSSFGVSPTDIYLANSLFLWRTNPSVLENTLLMPIIASRIQKPPNIAIIPCICLSFVSDSWIRFSDSMV